MLFGSTLALLAHLGAPYRLLSTHCRHWVSNITMVLTENEPEQDALFNLEGPDEDGCVWISSTDAVGWHHNLGFADKVAEVLSQWLASLDDAERDYRDTMDE